MLHAFFTLKFMSRNCYYGLLFFRRKTNSEDGIRAGRGELCGQAGAQGEEREERMRAGEACWSGQSLDGSGRGLDGAAYIVFHRFLSHVDSNVYSEVFGAPEWPENPQKCVPGVVC